MNSFIRLSILSSLFIILFVTTATAQYCLLPGRTPYSDLQPGIKNFKLNTINRTSGFVEDMSKVIVVTSDTTSLIPGYTYTVTITHTRDSVFFPTARNNIRVWIDYNNNNSFLDTGETVISADYKTYGTFTDTFKVPATTPLGVIRLRATAKMSSDAGHSLPTPCDEPVPDPIGYHGEMEDYFLKIVAAPTSITDLSTGAINISFYPNPANGIINVSFDQLTDGPVSIELFDITGKSRGSLLQEQKQTAQSYSFDLNSYAQSAGVYIIRVAAAGGTSYQRILKEN